MRKVSNSQRRKITSCIPSDTPEKDMFEKNIEKDKIKRKNKDDKQKAATRNLFAKKKNVDFNDISSSEEDGSLSFTDSDQDSTDWIPEADPSAFEELDRNPKPNDFVLVSFSAKNDNLFYVGKVINLESSNNEVEVKFLRKSVKFSGHFVYPLEPDVGMVPLNDAKMILPPPSHLGKTKRLQEYLKFEIQFSNINLR
ncbi:unnamed protein product [Acanthoscelides obtectus]|uniref:Uncharacterized protein n=1 Tax=Acanthoscelides obtectus TaxID=200917 RepID=A0A9P0K1W1_ACAOB|nr:unnamed protein product [Acanthoscelides obtectus]CAK1629713.1 hypothetical protein AOBTE_LOCUS5911 [Acanthoscelides obtectus]